MQTLLGFWAFTQRSSLLGGFIVTYASDDGFGNLIASPLPIHAINSLDFQ